MSKTPKTPKPADTSAPGPTPKSKDEINQSSLLEIVQAQAETIERQTHALEDFTDLVNDLRSRVEAKEEAGETVKRESDVFVDTFEEHNALKFKKSQIDPDSNFEYGRKLKWINPKLRQDIGPRGWVPVKLGDSFLVGEVKDLETGKVSQVFGAKLGEYLNAVPSRMEGSAGRDDHIRRGDLILAWIDMKTYIARMRRRDETALKKRSQLSNEGDVYDIGGRRGASVVGPGLTRSSDPNQPRKSPRSTWMPKNCISSSSSPLATTPTPSPEE